MTGNLANSRPSPVHSTYFSSFTRRRLLTHRDFTEISRTQISSDPRFHVSTNSISDYMIQKYLIYTTIASQTADSPVTENSKILDKTEDTARKRDSVTAKGVDSDDDSRRTVRIDW